MSFWNWVPKRIQVKNFIKHWLFPYCYMVLKPGRGKWLEQDSDSSNEVLKGNNGVYKVYCIRNQNVTNQNSLIEYILN